MPQPEAPVRTYVDLPAYVAEPGEVYLNGVLQEPGRDFTVEGRALVFDRQLRGEGRLGPLRWLSMLLGVAGTYRQDDAVDVIYEAGGRRQVASRLPYRSETR